MFERYTEKARRAIFFARYEASQFGSRFIETEHLLLGLLREDGALIARLAHAEDSKKPIVDFDDSAYAIRKQIEERLPHGERLPTSVNLPLSQGCKRVLAYAAEEAERAADRHIRALHLLLGLLREEKCLAAEILNQFGLRLSPIREDLARLAAYEVVDIEPPSQEWLRKTLSTPEMNAWFRLFYWEKRQCEPQDALKHRLTGQISLYRGQSYDAGDYEIVKAGWTYDHCAVCWNALSEADDPELSVGYTNGQDWLCRECYAIVS